MVVSLDVVAGNWTQDLWKSNQCSSSLSHLFSPWHFNFKKLWIWKISIFVRICIKGVDTCVHSCPGTCVCAGACVYMCSCIVCVRAVVCMCSYISIYVHMVTKTRPEAQMPFLRPRSLHCYRKLNSFCSKYLANWSLSLTLISPWIS